jgi:hypothetical protein
LPEVRFIPIYSQAAFTVAFGLLPTDPFPMRSLQRHGIREVNKQLHLRMQRSGLSSIKVHVTRRAGKLKFHFTGSEEEVKKAEKILADWN